MVARTCGLCQHSSFPSGDGWGTCDVHVYEHEKHSDKKRHLSVHEHGSCASFVMSEKEAELLGPYLEFVDP